MAPVASALAAPAAARAPSLTPKIVRLNLQHTWTTTMSSSQYRDTLHVAYTRDGITGHGEGAPIVRYKEDAESARKAVESVRDLLLAADPMHVTKMMAEVFKRVPGEWAAKSAIDIALMDWVGQKLGIPLSRYFGLDPKDAPVTTFSIGIDTPEITQQKTTEAEPYPVLKVKVGPRHGRADDRGGPQRHQEAAAGGRQRGLEDQGRGRPQDQLAGEAGRGVHRAAAAGAHARGDTMDARAGSTSRSSRTRRACAPPTSRSCARRTTASNIKLDKAGGMLRGAAR